jgi:hypothetical protein
MGRCRRCSRVNGRIGARLLGQSPWRGRWAAAVGGWWCTEVVRWRWAGVDGVGALMGPAASKGSLQCRCSSGARSQPLSRSSRQSRGGVNRNEEQVRESKLWMGAERRLPVDQCRAHICMCQ